MMAEQCTRRSSQRGYAKKIYFETTHALISQVQCNGLKSILKFKSICSNEAGKYYMCIQIEAADQSQNDKRF